MGRTKIRRRASQRSGRSSGLGALLLALTLTMAGCSSGSGSSGSSTTSSAGSTTGPSTTSGTSTTAPWPGLGSYLPLWPFRTAAEAQSWYEANAAHGTDAWHLDAGATALRFTTAFLGFAEVNLVVGTSMSANGAHVSVG
ncbi:MAG TPA: hypothetical protein VMU09_04215, partial [Acidimicrobiales bacterium]|nr:hypothetical protein [Acidimicrobiales bacterium]